MENLIDKTYDPKAAEEKWYAQWEKSGCFKPKKGKKGKTFSLIMPPKRDRQASYGACTRCHYPRFSYPL